MPPRRHGPIFLAISPILAAVALDFASLMLLIYLACGKGIAGWQVSMLAVLLGTPLVYCQPIGQFFVVVLIIALFSPRLRGWLRAAWKE